MNNKLKGLLFGASIFGSSMMMNGVHTAHADTWTANSVQQIEQQMKAQTKQGQKLVVYVVQRGDTLTGISIASKVPMKTIIDLNHITNANVLRVGEKINLGDSQSARAFVESKGQSVAENVKGYQAPKANKQNTTYQTNMGVANKGTVANGYVANNHYTPVANNSSHVVNNGSHATVNNTGRVANTGVATNGSHAAVNNGDHVANNGSHVANNGTTNNVHVTQQANGPHATVNNAQHVANNGNHVANNGSHATNTTQQTTGSHATVNGNHQTTGSQVTPSKPATGGNHTATKPVAPATEQLNAQKVNQTFQNAMSTKYGWNGTWMDSKEGYDKARDLDEHGAMDKISGYADAETWAGDKNPNKTLGEDEAKAMYENWKPTNEGYKCYKYGYSKTTVRKNAKGHSQCHTDYYLWN